jgi:hypothetical protein
VNDANGEGRKPLPRLAKRRNDLVSSVTVTLGSRAVASQYFQPSATPKEIHVSYLRSAVVACSPVG